MNDLTDCGNDAWREVESQRVLIVVVVMFSRCGMRRDGAVLYSMGKKVEKMRRKKCKLS